MRRNFLALSALLAAAHGLPDAFSSGCPRFKSKECAGHGRCVAALGGPVCQCEAGFERADCSMASFCPKDCSGRGHCTHPRGLGTANNPIAGTCECYDGYRGEACEEIVIPPQPYGCADFCSGHGRCTDGVCECHDGYNGPSCSRVAGLCPRNCSGHGECDEMSARCICDGSVRKEMPR